MAEVEKDERFYMTLVTIQVENCLFRVPRQLLESQSKIFRDMFSLPVAKVAEGSSDNDPIRLHGIKKEEFKRFLEVLSMSAWETNPKPCPPEMWLPVVKLARMWECDELYKYAVKSMPYKQICKAPAEKVAIAVQYDIKPWLLPALNELAQREESLGNYDLELLGPEWLLKVAAVRESLIVSNSRITSGVRNASNVDFTPVIKNVFHFSVLIMTRLQMVTDVDAPHKKEFREYTFTGWNKSRFK